MHARADLQQYVVVAMMENEGMNVNERMPSVQKRFAVSAAPFQLAHASKHAEYAFSRRQSMHAELRNAQG
jgi:hypothetical protein